ncbi:hypothetical protein GCM10023200_11520 [Actinomycetospora chlora]|uniref:Uncharacterized protein n=2 Tax=Actinomycetospora chlora TaxID=663608 RepID=A0ABP9AEF5_9PSEU
MGARRRRDRYDELIAAGRFEEATAWRHRQIDAQVYRHRRGLLESLMIGQRRSRSAPGAGEMAAMRDLQRELQRDLEKHPEFANEELLRQLAPTRWETFVDWLRGRSAERLEE